jgi:RND family efflux transporter MFP subunit
LRHSLLRFILYAVVALGLIESVPAPVHASPMIVPVGAAQATLTLTPDPPQTGRIMASLVLAGVSADALARTTASFSSAMPTMSMSGPSGAPRLLSPGHWQFEMSLAMAAAWNVSVHFSGGVNGTATYTFAVSGGANTGASNMSGMSSSVGNPDAWRDAAIALVVVVAGGVTLVIIRRDRRPLTLGLIAGAAAVVVILAVVSARYAAPPMDMAAMTSVHGDAATPVTLASVHLSQSSTDIHAPGSIAAFLTQDVVTRAPGILMNFSLYAGDKVRAGQVIASLDSPDLHSRAAAAAADAAGQSAAAQAAEIEANHHAPNAVIIARADTAAMQRDLVAAQADRTAKAAQLRYWENEVRREKTLLDQGAVSAQEYQDEQTQYAAAQGAYSATANKVGSIQQQLIVSRTKAMDAVASVEQMRAQAQSARDQADKAAAQATTESTLASFTTITSPEDAIVVKRLVDPGVYVAAGTVIARIAVVRKLRVQANVAQQDIAAISVGTPIDARLQDGTIVRGRVTSVSPIADSTTHTASVEAIVDNERTDLVPGGYVQVTLHTRSQPTPVGVGVPSTAIVGSGSEAAVWTSVNGTAHRIPVHLVSDDGSTATVRGDLDRKARVVIDGAATLQEGQSITESRA